MCALTREEVCTIAQDLKIEVNDASVIHFSAVLVVLGSLRLLQRISTTALMRTGNGTRSLIRNKCSSLHALAGILGFASLTWGEQSV